MVAPAASTSVTVSPELDRPLGAKEKSAVWPDTALNTARLLLPTKYWCERMTVPGGKTVPATLSGLLAGSSEMPAVKAQPEMSMSSTPRL